MRQNMNRKSFTLIEVLLALFITAILITILSVVFNTGLRSYRQGKDLLEITRKGQLILGQITRDLSGAMVQENYISFIGNNNSIYFMAPVENSSEKGVDLCEIGYNFTQDELKRHFITADADNYQYPSEVVYSNEYESTFCEKVRAFNLKYHNGDNWDEDSPWGERYELPEMVEITVEIYGKYPTGNPQSKVFTTWVYLPYSTNNP